jgi:hypothetical protein
LYVHINGYRFIDGRHFSCAAVWAVGPISHAPLWHRPAHFSCAILPLNAFVLLIGIAGLDAYISNSIQLVEQNNIIL